MSEATCWPRSTGRGRSSRPATPRAGSASAPAWGKHPSVVWPTSSSPRDDAACSAVGHDGAEMSTTGESSPDHREATDGFVPPPYPYDRLDRFKPLAEA